VGGAADRAGAPPRRRERCRAAALELLSEPYLRFSAQRGPRWDDAFVDSPFEPLQYRRLDDAADLDPDDLLELYSTTSSLASLPDDERNALLGRVRPLLTGRYRLPTRYKLTWTRLAR